MAGLLDFLQAASNSAASNVSAPVDALAWLLRKAGIPVPDDAVGGSQWMAQKGLTRPVQQSGASLAGESVGLLAPVAAAAKAPQIARGLLQMGENAAAPRMQGAMGQRGALVVAPHEPDPSRLEDVMRQMRELGPPDIRAVWDDASGAYRALEGSHRLAAAKKLGVEPNLIEMVPREWMGRHDFPDIKDKASVARILEYLSGSKAYVDFPGMPGRFDF